MFKHRFICERYLLMYCFKNCKLSSERGRAEKMLLQRHRVVENPYYHCYPTISY